MAIIEGGGFGDMQPPKKALMVATFIICKAPCCVHHHQVLLIEKQRPNWQKGLWNAIGGHVEEGESFIRAAVREIKEEVGMEIPPRDLKQVCVLSGSDWLVNFFVVFVGLDVWATWVKVTDEDPKVLTLLDLHEAPVIPNLRYLLPMALLAEDPKFVPLVIEEAETHDQFVNRVAP